MFIDHREWPTGFVPFIVVACLGQLSLGWPLAPVQHPGWAAVASAAFLTTFVLAVVVMRAGSRSALRHAPPYLFLVVVALWRQADGGATSGFAPMLGLPVLWLALHGSLRQVIWAVVGVGLVLGAPMLLVGAPDYPPTDWRRAVLWVGLSGLLGPLTHALVRERAQAEVRVGELRTVETRLDGILHAAGEHAIIATDLGGTITTFNPGAEALLGWRAEELVGRHSPLLLHDPEELAVRAAALGMEPGLEVLVHQARLGGAESRPWTYRRRDGAQVMVSLTISGLHDGAGSLVGFVVIGVDVTELTQVVAAVRHEREVQRLLIEHLPDTIVGLLDEDLRWVTVGGQWLIAQGMEAEDMVGQPLQHEGVRALCAEGLERAVSGEYQPLGDLYFATDAVPIAGPDGQRLVLVLARDVTESRTSERERAAAIAALAVSEEGFRTTFESAPIGIALTSVDPGPERRFLQVNAAFAQLLGRAPKHIEGTRVADLTHPEDRGVALSPALGVPAENRRLQTRFLHADGRPVWTEVFYSLVRDAAGEPSYFITHVEDITRRKESERALLDALDRQREAAAVLREADRVRSDVMSTVSHELRTPLTSVAGYLELLTDGAAGPLSVEQGRMVDVALRNADRLRGLIDDLLVLTRLDAQDRVGTRDQRVDVAAMAAMAVESVRPLVDPARQGLELLPVGPRPWVLGDREQLDRVLVNLLSNALKFTPDEGRVTVEVDRVEDEVRISVTDTGIGIPAPEQARLFDRFYRARAARERGIDGTGLGLAIVKSIVERHRGHLGVESAPGLGSRFVVRLPAVDGPEDA